MSASAVIRDVSAGLGVVFVTIAAAVYTHAARFQMADEALKRRAVAAIFFGWTILLFILAICVAFLDMSLAIGIFAAALGVVSLFGSLISTWLMAKRSTVVTLRSAQRSVTIDVNNLKSEDLAQIAEMLSDLKGSSGTGDRGSRWQRRVVPRVSALAPPDCPEELDLLESSSFCRKVP